MLCTSTAIDVVGLLLHQFRLACEPKPSPLCLSRPLFLSLSLSLSLCLSLSLSLALSLCLSLAFCIAFAIRRCINRIDADTYAG